MKFAKDVIAVLPKRLPAETCLGLSSCDGVNSGPGNLCVLIRLDS
jgi:hypothetical protein